MNHNQKIRALCECGVMLAVAQILGYIKLFRFAWGGSITLNMLPIFIVCARWGFGYGMVTSFCFGGLQLMLDGFIGIGWQSMLGDYIVAYAVLGLAGLCYHKKGGLFTGTLVGSLARWIVAWITGAVVWGEYMPERFLGMTMTSPWIYSALYNGCYIFASMVLCLVVEGILWKADSQLLKRNVA